MTLSRLDDGHANKYSYIIKECQNITEQGGGGKPQFPLRVENESFKVSQSNKHLAKS